VPSDLGQCAPLVGLVAAVATSDLHGKPADEDVNEAPRRKPEPRGDLQRIVA
jgi:hypothetical protein